MTLGIAQSVVVLLEMGIAVLLAPAPSTVFTTSGIPSSTIP